MLTLLLSLACSPDRTPGLPPSGDPSDAITCVPFSRPPQEVELEPAFPEMEPFTYPVMLTRGGDDWYVVQRTGEILRFTPGDAEPELVLDLSDRVDPIGDAGLSAIALDPDFADNQVFYVFYATSSAPLVGDGSGEWRARLSRFTVGSPEETALLEIEEPEESHIHANDDLQFGPDGYLYLSLGDGGPQEDGHGHGQDLGALQGKILRIAVDADAPGYTVPADNPFVGQEGALPEIWAYGLRNPWRFSFDDEGALWVGDVGYTEWEEIDRVEAGDNLGWVIKEGPECFEADTCDEEGLVDPVVAHDHYSARSITGGRFYAGAALDTLAGAYIYADYQYGQVWAFGEDRVPRIVNGDGHGIASFAQEEDGELLAVDIADGVIYRLVDGEAAAGDDGYPELLSQTGCVLPDAPDQKIESLYAYAINQPFWSDGADKDRWLGVPEGEELEIQEDGDLDVPEGAVLIKDFRLDGVLVETRILAYHGDDIWSSLSYRWNAAQTEASLVPAGETPVIAEWPAGEWTHPTRGMCRECHGAAPGGSLGLELPQLARDAIDARLGSDQLDGMVAVGLLDDDLPEITPFPAIDDESAPIDLRARAFLHVNCGYCHRPHGRGRGDMDLQFSIPIADTFTCDVEPEFGDLLGEGSRIIDPGHPESSVLLERISIVGDNMMPPIGRSVVDEEAVEVIRAWIAAMPSDGEANCEVP